MASKTPPSLPAPRRGEIWSAYLAPGGQQRHWVLIVSLDERNLSPRALTVLILPFASRLAESPSSLILQAGETGLPGASCLRGHFITTLPKANLISQMPRALSDRRMREVSLAIRRAFDPDSPF